RPGGRRRVAGEVRAEVAVADQPHRGARADLGRLLVRERQACYPRPALSTAGLVQLVVDAPRRLRRHARYALELLRRRFEHLLDRPEVVEQRAPTRRADALQVVEDGCEAARLATLSVKVERETVRLVADPLQELQPRVVPREHD